MVSTSSNVPTTIWISSLPLLVLLLLTDSSASFVSGSNMTRLGSASGAPGGNFDSAIIDTTNQVGYFGTLTSPGLVVKFNLTTMSRIGSASGVSGENFFRSAIIDTTNQVGFFGTSTPPGIVVKFNLTTMMRIGRASGVGGETFFYSAIIDTTRQVGFFGTGTYPGIVVKFDLITMTRIGSASGVSGENNFFSAIIDSTNQVGYFGTVSFPGIVVKFNLTTMTRIGSAGGVSGENVFRSAIIDTTSQVGYFGTNTNPGMVVEFNLATMTRIGYSRGVPGENNFYSTIIDTTNQVGYFGTFTNPGIVVKFNLTTMTSIGSASGVAGEDRFYSAIIDTTNQVGYFGTNLYPGIIVKFNLATMATIGTASGIVGEDRFYSAIIDTTNQVGYFGTSTSPGIVVKFNLTTMTRIGRASGFSGENRFYSAIIDTTNQVGYFGANSNPGIIVKFNLTTMTRIGSASGVSGETFFYSAIIDTTNQVGYFGTNTSPGLVVKFNLATMTRVRSASGVSGEDNFYSAIIDTASQVGYFGTSSSPGIVVKFNLTTMTRIGSASGVPGENLFYSAIIDTTNQVGYFGTNTNPGIVVKFNLATMARIGSASAGSGESSFRCSFIDTTNQAGYFGTDTSPGIVVKFNLDTTTISSCGEHSGLTGYVDVTTLESSCPQLIIRDSSLVTLIISEQHSIDDIVIENVECSRSTYESCVYFTSTISNVRKISIRGISRRNIDTAAGTVLSVVTFADTVSGVNSSNSRFLSISDVSFSDSHLITRQSSVASFDLCLIRFDRAISNFDLIEISYMSFQNVQFNGVPNTPVIRALSLTSVIGNATRVTIVNSSVSDFPSVCTTSSCSFIELSSSSSDIQSHTVIEGVWSFSNNSMIQWSDSFPFIKISESAVVSAHFTFSDNYISNENSNILFNDDSQHDDPLVPVLSNLNSSTWIIGCNNWSSSVDSRLYLTLSHIDFPRLLFRCRTQSLSTSLTPSTSPTATRSLSTSASASESVYCYNLNEIECSRVGSNNCHFCSDRQTCVPRENDCGCYQFPKSLCDFSSSGLVKGCHFCSSADICIEDGLDCECSVFGQTACQLATSTCRWCPNFKSCLPLHEDCYCSSLSETPCDSLSDNKCKYCGDQQICLPIEDINENNCSCMKMNSSNCQQSTCTWCSEYQTCSVPEWDCNCLSYSNDSTSCAVNSNNHCKYCSDEDVCVDTQKFTCRCENFTQSACDASSCKWCDDLNSCSVPQNTNCSCYYLRDEDSCSTNSNERCKWCAQSSDTGKDKLDDFNYCVNKEQDQCECSYLSPSFCSFSTTANASAMKFSSTCRYCEVDQVCSHPSNTECDCGNFLSSHACALATTCSWKEPVLTIDDGSEYCSLAAACAPVTCAGILSPASCRSSGCEWDSTTSRCTSSTCFNFFINGFTVQPFLMYVIGLFKDVLVVFLIGAFSGLINRPVMKFITSVKQKIKNQHHIKQQMMEQESNVYISDRSCRDGLKMGFAQYVEKVCESVFELESADLLDEKNRLKLFDTVAFTLFDNMIWLDLDLMKATAKASSFATSTRFESEEMEDMGTSNHEEHDHGGNDNDEELIVSDESRAPMAHLPTKKLTASEMLENLFAKALTQFRGFDPIDEADVNSHGQFLTQCASFMNKEATTYLKTKNVDLLKIKVILSETDFESAVDLRKKVNDALVERASAYVFYDQSRSRMVCGATGMNTFPPALSLLYYSIAIVALFISSFITVLNTENIHRMVSTCENSLVSEESSISNSTNETTFAPSSNSTTNTTSNSSSTSSSIDQQGTVKIDGTFLTGAYFLLGFRLLNASAFSTAILVFVKTLRGIYQKYSGIYSLTLQERIPLMSLYSDRLIHILLFIYALLVLPFALAGPFYGGFALSFHCWIPIFVGAAILCGDALILFISRKISSFRKKMISTSLSSSSAKRFDADGLALAFDGENSTDVSLLRPSSSLGGVDHRNDDSDDDADAIHSPREAQRDDDDDESTVEEAPALPSNNPNTSEAADVLSSTSATALDKDVIEQQSSISSSSPIEIWNALLVFVLTEEIPVIVISLALQASFNYCALLQYGDAFGVSHDHSTVYSKDYDSRKIECIIRMFQSDVSSFLSGLSSFVPFM